MLPDSKISLMLALQIPGMAVALNQLCKSSAVCKVMHAFADYTGNLIRHGELPEAKKCFTLAAVLYHNGSNAVKNAIESVYIYGLSPLLDTIQHNRPVKELLPQSLHHIRIRQLQAATI